MFINTQQVNGESVEENANLVIRLLIRRPECLGPALRGEGEGLLRAIVDANTMSEKIADRRKLADTHHGGADGMQVSTHTFYGELTPNVGHYKYVMYERETGYGMYNLVIKYS